MPDGQAMQQAMMSMMSAVQSGANYILHSAGVLDGLLSMSYDYAVTVPLLRLEPVWKPLQDHPRLLALFEKYETEVD